MSREKVKQKTAIPTTEEHSMIGRVVGIGGVSFIASFVNDRFINNNPVAFSQMVMEGVDIVLPKLLGPAIAADKVGKHKKAVKWRSVTNGAHIAAASYGIINAFQYMNEDPDIDSKSIVISMIVGGANLGILKKIREMRRNHKDKTHHKVLMSADAITNPLPAEDVVLESHHVHDAMSARNIENLSMCVTSNIVEAVPAFVGPIAQLGWENGSAATVIASNAAVLCMAGWQQIKDLMMLQQLRQVQAEATV